MGKVVAAADASTLAAPGLRGMALVVLAAVAVDDGTGSCHEEEPSSAAAEEEVAF